MIVSSDAAPALLSLDFVNGVYRSGDAESGSATDLPEVRNTGPGRLSIAPDGTIRVSPPDQPRRIAGVGLRIDKASQNLLRIVNAAPTSTAGWTLLSNRPAGATISLVNDRSALDASGIFAEPLAAGIMNGQVIRFYNPSPDTDFAIPFFFPNGQAVAISSYVRVVSGSGYISVTGGGGQTPAFVGAGWQRVGRKHNAGQQARFVISPMSEVLVILTQVEQDVISQPIVFSAGAASVRAADVLEIVGDHLFGSPHTIVAEIEIDQVDGIERSILTLLNLTGQGVATTRRTDNALTLVPTNTLRRPRLPRIQGPGRLRIAQRVMPRGTAIAAGGFMSEEPFNIAPTGLRRLIVGTAADGGLALGGWIRSIEVHPELSDDDFEAATAPGAGTMPLDIARYVSPNGDDASDGKTPGTAWRTLAKIADTLNGAGEGTHYHLQRGGSWQETLRPRNNSWFRPYGAGARPKVGIGQVNGVDENAAGAFRLLDIHVTGATQRGVNSFGASAVQIDKCEVSDCGSLTDNNAGGIFVRGANRQATAVLLSSPAGSSISGVRTTEAGLSGNFTITCTTAGAGSASRWQVRRPDNSIISTVAGGTAFNSGGIQFTVTSTSATKVGDQFVVRNPPFSEIPFPVNGVSNDVMIRNTHVHDIYGLAAGDDIYCEGIGGIGIFEGNRLEIPLGRAADCLQASRATSVYLANPLHAIVRGNYMSMQGKDTESGKGCCVLLCGSALVESNHLDGLNFCLSLGLEKGGIIRWNVVRDATLNTYSWGIGVGVDTDTKLLQIYENEVIACTRGIAFSGTGATTMTVNGRISRTQYRSDLVVINNVVRECPVGIFVDRPTSGRIVANMVYQPAQIIDRRTTAIPPNSVARELSIQWNRLLSA